MEMLDLDERESTGKQALSHCVQPERLILIGQLVVIVVQELPPFLEFNYCSRNITTTGWCWQDIFSRGSFISGMRRFLLMVPAIAACWFAAATTSRSAVSTPVSR